MKISSIIACLWRTQKAAIEAFTGPAHEYEEAETENLMRDHKSALDSIRTSNDQIEHSQNKLLESIRLARPHEMRETFKTALERNKWRG